jgi:ABC-type transporter Mla subunit MlaD
VRRRDEVLVGATIIASLAAIIFGALYLSSQELGVRTEIRVARFRTTGGLGVGAPLTLRGVRVGSVSAIELGEGNFVEVRLKINEDDIIRGMVPERPAVIVASASLFGEWEARLIDLDFPPDDANVLADLQLVMDAGDDGAWPGATLPDIGQLTAQASRIAGNITDISDRVTTVLDDEAVSELQQTIRYENARGVLREAERGAHELCP